MFILNFLISSVRSLSLTPKTPAASLVVLEADRANIIKDSFIMYLIDLYKGILYNLLLIHDNYCLL